MDLFLSSHELDGLVRLIDLFWSSDGVILMGLVTLKNWFLRSHEPSIDEALIHQLTSSFDRCTCRKVVTKVILCNYCATMEVPSSNEELFHD